MEQKTQLTPDEKLRAAYAHIINGIDQHHISALFGVNSGRVSEACQAVRHACGYPSTRRTSPNSFGYPTVIMEDS